MNAFFVVLAAVVAVGSCNYYGVGNNVMLSPVTSMGGYYGAAPSFVGGMSYGSVGLGRYGGAGSVIALGNDDFNGGFASVGGFGYPKGGSIAYRPVVQSVGYASPIMGGKFGGGVVGGY